MTTTRCGPILTLASSLVLAIVLVSSAYAQPDGAPPTLAALSLSPAVIDTTAAGATVVVTAHVTDAGSGAASVYAQFRHSSGQSHGMTLSRTSGDAADGTYSGSFSFPQLSAAGAWTLVVVSQDALGNRRDLYSDDLAALGFPATLTNGASLQDKDAPALVGLTMSPPTIDTGGAAATVTLTAHVTDAQSGVAAVSAQFRHSTGQRHGLDLSLASGNAADGTYSRSFSFPILSAGGSWTLVVVVADAVGNRTELFSDDLASLGFPATLVNAATVADATAPALAAFSFTPSSIDTSNAGATVTVTGHVTDAQSGVAAVYAQFRNSSGQTHGANLALTSGTAADGTYSGSVSFPQGGASGWTLLVTADDAIGNRRVFYSDDLVASGFSAALTSLCPAAPAAGCKKPFVPQKAQVLLKRGSSAAGNVLAWKWIKGASTTPAELADPTAGNGYAVCVYDAGGLVGVLNAPAGGTCDGAPCWKAKKTGFAYKNKLGGGDGLQQILLKSGVDAHATIKVKAKGANLALPNLGALTSPVTVQIRKSSGDACWDAVYSFPPAQKNDATQFKDKAD